MRIRGIAALLFSALPLFAQVPPSRFERALPVAAPGWCRLDLDPETRGKMTPDARDLRVWDPDGREVPFRLLERLSGAGPVEARVLAVQEGPAGWVMEFDLGPEVQRHRAFRFEFGNRAAASGCTLEGSEDRARWTPLSQGDLFRLGESAELSTTVLAYPVTTARYLRLFWPKGAGYPDVRRAEAEPAPPSTETLLEVALALHPEGTLPGGRVYRVTLPGAGADLRRLRMVWSGPGSVSYRLSEAVEGRWITVAEGAIARTLDGATPEVSVRLEHPDSPELRLELASGAPPPPSLTAVWGAFEPQRAVFRAEQAGRFRVTYGSVGLAPPSYPAISPPAPPEELPALVLGPEREIAPPGLPAGRTAEGAPMPTATFASAWAVQAPGASAGTLMRLELPAEVYGVARPDLGDIRLESGGRQVPFFLHSPPEPALAGEWLGQRPMPGRRPGESEFALPETAPGLPLTALEMRVSAAAFHRPVVVRFSGQGSRPGREEQAQVFYGDWSCPGTSDLLSRLIVPLWGPARGKLLVTFTDGDNPPLPAVDVLLWRRRHVVLFLAPPGPVRLMAGSPGLGAPRYDLPALGAQLLAMPSAEATTVPSPGGGGRTGSSGVWFALIGALVLCGAALLFVLARALRRPAAGEQGSSDTR